MSDFPVLHYDYVQGINQGLSVMLSSIRKGQLGSETASVALNGRYDATLSLQLQVMSDYDRWGQQVFVLGPCFQTMLAKTELNAIPKEKLNLPYPCFYLALQDCPWQIHVPESGGHPITGVYVQGNPTEEKPRELVLFLWGAEHEGSRTLGDDASVWIRLDIKDAFSKGKNLEQALEAILQEGDDCSSPGMGLDYLEAQQVKETNRSMVRILRLVLNMILYLQIKDAERVVDTSIKDKRLDLEKEIADIHGRMKNQSKAEKKTRHKKRELASLPDAHITWLWKKSEEKYASGTGSTHGPCIRHWVRGHWRNLADSRTVWVRPYERYKESPVGAPRQYKYKEDQESMG